MDADTYTPHFANVDALTLEDGELFHNKKGKVREMPVPLAPLADTHGHLTQFETRKASVALCRAALAGVRMLVVPVDPSDDVPDADAFLAWLDQVIAEARERLAECAEHGLVPPAFDGPAAAGSAGSLAHPLPDLLDDVWIVAGVHPYGARTLRDDPAVWERLQRLLADRRCVGVGEIGLDLGPYNEVPLEVQQEQFARQLVLARELDMPVELHIRDARDDPEAAAHAACIKTLDAAGFDGSRVDLHCFTSGPEVMAPFVERGCHIAFGGAVTFKRSDDIRAAAAACPEELLFSETDCPYMAPVPLRGDECEPAMVGFSAACVADVRAEALGTAREETYRALWRNARSFFHMP